MLGHYVLDIGAGSILRVEKDVEHFYENARFYAYDPYSIENLYDLVVVQKVG